jgi:hypothetical protein
MLAHAGGASSLGAPPWLLAYGAAAIVLVTTVWCRGRLVVGDAEARARARGDQRDDGRPPPTRAARGRFATVGHAVGVAGLVGIVAVALAGPDVSGANLAPSAVLSGWWVGLPLACLLFGDVMAWLAPFGTLARLLPGHGRWRAPGRAATGAAFLAAFAWWVLAYEGAREPAALGWFLMAYTVAALAGAWAWGPAWAATGEGFGALSAALAGLRRAAWTGARGRPAEPPLPGLRDAPGLAALVGVWLGATAFDLYAGTASYVELAGARTGWARTWLSTGLLFAAVVVAAAAVALTMRATRPAAAAAAGLAGTAGAFLAHGVPSLLVDGQLMLALASDPLGRGWDLFGTATRPLDYSPVPPGAVGAFQLVAVAAGGVGGVLAASALIGGGTRAVRHLWVLGVVLAAGAAAAVLAVAADAA